MCFVWSEWLGSSLYFLMTLFIMWKGNELRLRVKISLLRSSLKPVSVLFIFTGLINWCFYQSYLIIHGRETQNIHEHTGVCFFCEK